jgi:hypothetical protein
VRGVTGVMQRWRRDFYKSVVRLEQHLGRGVTESEENILFMSYLRDSFGLNFIPSTFKKFVKPKDQE